MAFGEKLRCPGPVLAHGGHAGLPPGAVRRDLVAEEAIFHGDHIGTVGEQPDDVPGVRVRDVERRPVGLHVVVVLAQGEQVVRLCWPALVVGDAVVQLALLGGAVALRVDAGAVAGVHGVAHALARDVAPQRLFELGVEVTFV